MKILYIIPYPPDLIRVRSYQIIRNMVARGHQVTVATLWSNEEERQAVEDLKKYCDAVYSHRMTRTSSMVNCVAAIPSAVPFQAVYCWQPSFAEELYRIFLPADGKPHFDIVHVEHLRGVKYGLFFQKEIGRLRSADTPKVVWDSVDCISKLFRQAVLENQGINQLPVRIDLQRTEYYEGWLLDQFKRVLVTSELDKNALLSIYNGRNKPEITVVPNGVDLEYFSPDDRIPRDPATLVVSGKMSYHANIAMVHHLVRDIMPIVWKARPEVKLTIVGKNPPREISRLADHPSIEVTGYVPDIRPFLRSATISVAPLTYGAGIQNKVLEAMACGTPVIASHLAVSALSVSPNTEIMVEDDAVSFARAVLDLLSRPEKQGEISRSGREYVEGQHDWSNIVQRLELIYTEIASCQ